MQDQNNEKKEKVWKFDGRHANLKVFNRCVMTELEAEDRLAAAILRGNIAIKETQTVMGSIVTHIGCIMTQIMLTIMIVNTYKTCMAMIIPYNQKRHHVIIKKNKIKLATAR